MNEKAGLLCGHDCRGGLLHFFASDRLWDCQSKCIRCDQSSLKFLRPPALPSPASNPFARVRLSRPVMRAIRMVGAIGQWMFFKYRATPAAVIPDQDCLSGSVSKQIEGSEHVALRSPLFAVPLPKRLRITV